MADTGSYCLTLAVLELGAVFLHQASWLLGLQHELSCLAGLCTGEA